MAQGNEIEVTIVGKVKPMKLPSSEGIFLALPHKDIPVLVVEYVAAIETQETNNWCRCEWIIHPDDVEIPDNHCRVCGTERDNDVHIAVFAEREHMFQGKRMRRGDEASDCPVHTKEGFLMYFFEWVFTREKD